MDERFPARLSAVVNGQIHEAELPPCRVTPPYLPVCLERSFLVCLAHIYMDRRDPV